MESRYLIDTNAIIGYLDGKIEPSGMVFMHPIVDQGPNISVINKIEVLRFNPKDGDKTLGDFIASSHVFGLTDDIVELTITIAKVSRIKLPDAIIAATAIANNLTLITRNVSDFKKIEELKWLNPWDIK